MNIGDYSAVARWDVCCVTMQLTPGSPAARIGLRTGDEIVEIASTSTSSLTYQQSLDLINSHNDTILLTVERYPVYDRLSFTLR